MPWRMLEHQWSRARGNPDVAEAERLLITSEAIETDPKSLHLRLRAARLLLDARETELLVGVLGELFGFRWRYGYYSAPQYDLIEELLAEVLDAYAPSPGVQHLTQSVQDVLMSTDTAITLLTMIAKRQATPRERKPILPGGSARERERRGSLEDDAVDEWAALQRQRVFDSCQSATRELALDDPDAALSHLVEAFRAATISGAFAPAPDMRATLDDTARLVLTTLRPLGEWRTYLFSEAESGRAGVPVLCYLLGWVACEQARLGDIADARVTRHAMEELVIESYDDMELELHREIRDDAVERATAAIDDRASGRR